MSDGNEIHGSDVDPHDLFERHRATAEPLSEGEVTLLHDAGVADRSKFSMRGGQLFWHDPTFPEPDTGSRDVPRPQEMVTAEAFRTWLGCEVEWWCQREGLAPHGEGENLGDLYREFDVADVFARMGVTAIPAYEDHILYLIGPDAGWIASTRIDLGVEYESVWVDPLASLRLDVPPAELLAYRDRLRRTADEISALLDPGCGP